MLSATYSITDIKKEFETYGKYGYSTDAEFVTALTNAIGTVERERLIPIMTEGTYDAYALLDKTGLTTLQQNIYYAEIYFAAAEFILLHNRRAKYNRVAMNESRGQGEVSSSMSGATGKSSVAQDYIQRAEFLIAAGGFIAPVRLGRRTGIYDYTG